MKVKLISIASLTLSLLLFQNCEQSSALKIEGMKASTSGQNPPADTISDTNTPNNNETDSPPNLPPLQNYKSCTLNNEQKPHLWWEWALKNTTLPGSTVKETCDLFELQQCIDGNINYLSGDFNDRECTSAPYIKIPTGNPCTVNGKTIPHNHMMVLFENSIAAPGHNCVGQIRRCINGALTGSNQYQSLTCAEPNYKPEVAYDCQFNGTKVPDGAVIISFYEEFPKITAQNPRGACNFQPRRCIQGRLSDNPTLPHNVDSCQ